MRQRIEALLVEYERSGKFLDVPALEQMKATYLAQDAPTDGEPSGKQHSAEATFPFLEPSDSPDSIGRLAHYEITELLGRGGCGIVFKAFDERLHRTVAIKVMKPELAVTSPARKMFLREARATASIRHENVVGIYAVEDSPVPFLVMEYVDGKSLQELHEETGPFEIEAVLRIGKKIARGLAAAHDRGLIHRDIKPGNILIEAGTEQVKITDFGLARAADDASQTQSGIAGTPSYMSPEQALGHRLDSRSDLFSLGSVLYVMCSGRLPFRAPKPIAVMNRIIDEKPRDIREIIPETPQWITDVVRKLHHKNPAKRFQTAGEVADLLDDYQRQLQNLDIAAAGKNARLRPAVMIVSLLCLLLFSMGATEATGLTSVSSSVIRLFYPEGTLVIDVGDPQVSVSVDGREIVVSGTGIKELKLKPGSYRFVATKEGQILRQELVTVSRNGREVIRISREPPPETAPDLAEVDVDRRAAEYVLSIGGKIRINDDSTYGETPNITSVENLPPGSFRLTHASLDRNERVTDAGLAAFQGTTNLRGLFMERSPNYTDAGLANFRQNRGLKVINIGESNIDGSCLKYFTNCSELVDLRVGFTRITHENLSLLPSLSGMKTLNCLLLTYTPADDATVADLKQAPHLNFLTLEGTSVSDDGLKHLEDLRELHTLFLTKTKVTQAGFHRISQVLPRTTIHWNERVSNPVPVWTPTADQQTFFDSVARLPIDRQLEVVKNRIRWENPEFGSHVIEKVEDGQIVSLSFNGDGLARLWPVRALPHLRELWISGSHMTHSGLTDLAPLQGLPLTTLDISNSSVSDLSPLRGLNLKKIYCAHTKISDLSPLAGMSLEVLFFWCNEQLSDLSPVAGMPLKYVNCDLCSISDLSPLKGMPLERLAIYGTPVNDLEPIRGMPLWELSCGQTRIVNLSPLEGMKLRRLECAGLPVSDFSMLAGMPLEKLEAGNCGALDTLAPIAGCPLTELDLSGSKVADLTPLAPAPLKVVKLDRTLVADLAPLQGKTLDHLSCNDTRVRDLAALGEATITQLHCSGLDLIDLQPLKSLSLKELTIDLPFHDPAAEELVRDLSVRTINSRSAGEFWEQRRERREELQQFSRSLESLAAADQISALRTKLDEYNDPEKTTLQFSQTDDKVRGLTLSLTEQTRDLTPLVAMTTLEQLTLPGAPARLDLSPLVSLPLRELTCPPELAKNSRETIRRIATLKTVNGTPIDQFLAN
ncbi:serine/threonine-protein kinase [Rubinisphaera margarita]|uniref:serine/threonine-protein kinase n=1 Tax=Rubinisphaera margarita TaxID=2909586 RepID=UPI001EE97B69|nr:serine/threonine-protein kinase [Rubinisphaera margarita]MCG6157011.1 serine/threonine protein kinase [Rubinisphaera margarita]